MTTDTPRIRKGCRIEVRCTARRRRGGTGRPSYRWVQGWEVFDPKTGRWCAPMQLKHARAMVRDMKAAP